MSFNLLPPEIAISLLLYLDIRSLLVIFSVDQSLYKLRYDCYFWQQYINKYYPSLSQHPLYITNACQLADNYILSYNLTLTDIDNRSINLVTKHKDRIYGAIFSFLRYITRLNECIVNEPDLLVKKAIVSLPNYRILDVSNITSIIDKHRIDKDYLSIGDQENLLHNGTKNIVHFPSLMVEYNRNRLYINEVYLSNISSTFIEEALITLNFLKPDSSNSSIVNISTLTNNGCLMTSTTHIYKVIEEEKSCISTL